MASQADLEIVAQGNKKWMEVFASEKISQGLGDCYHHDAQLTHFGTFGAFHGPQPIADFFQNFLHGQVGARNPVLTSHVVQRIDENTIYELGKVKASLAAGGEIEAPYTVVWTKGSNNEYKIKYDTF
ncbi:predicted protein [Naegleria gruberi]|uniref:Predicted protein n=1 Tax=Naegleria gruberi TaxID=5762 RepID=D2VCJ6_NAEGR|nr:uncharacterized protein NAEGRDRAFT_79438 [Naegleria gruberi]EFC45324.1 predicted protein [Naegleria gruberi]|eukprot:XP_002678068.1 predicted protein [Naegleria gruberi strain NEG-M]